MLNRMFLTLGAFVFVATLGLAAPVLATPVTLYVDDNPNQRANFDIPNRQLILDPNGVGAFGWEPSDVAAAMAAGVPELPVGSLFDDILGERIEAIVLNNPITPTSNPTSPSKLDPVQATAMFQLTAMDRDYFDLSLIILGKSPIDPTGNFYAPGNTGIEIDAQDGWGLIQPDPTNFPDLYYLSLRVGDLLQGQSVVLDVEYRVAQSLLLVDPGPPQTFELPQLWVGYMEDIPEAGGLMWIIPAIVSVIAMRREED